MNCAHIRDNIDDYLDACEDSHVADCAECRELLGAVRRDRELLRGLEPLSVPIELRHRIREELRREVRFRKAKPPAWKFFVPRLAPVAAAIMVFVAGANVVPSLASKGMMRSAAPDPEVPMLAAPPGVLAEGDPAPKERDGSETPLVAPSPDDSQVGIADVVETDDEFTAMATVGNADEDMLIAAEATARPLWVNVAMGGAVLMVLWSAVVLIWYRRL